MALEKIFDGVLFKRREKRLLRHAGLQAEQKRSALICGHDVPHFRFAAAAGGLFVDGSVNVVGMNLDG